jgi:hypothetical protein
MLHRLIMVAIGVGLRWFVDGGWALPATVGEEDAEQWHPHGVVDVMAWSRGGSRLPVTTAHPLDRSRDGGGVKLWQ